MTVQEAIEILEAHGWRQADSANDVRQFGHETRQGYVTLSGKLDLEVPPGALKSLWRYTQIEGDG